MNILFTICGRAGSKGFKNKNLKILNKKPLVYYSLSAIALYQKANSINNIVVAVNTDSKDLIDILKKQKLIENIYFVERKEGLAGDIVPKVKVIQDTFLECRHLCDFDAIVDLDITSPMRRVIDIENAIKEFCQDNKYDVVYSVVSARRSPYFNMVEKRGQYYHKICQSNYTARQQAPKGYELNASIYVYNPAFLLSKIEKTIFDYNCGIVEMTDYLILDIDSEEDFELLQEMIKIFCKKDEKLKEVMEFKYEEEKW